MSSGSFSPLLAASLDELAHALDHINKGKAKDLRFAVISADNAVELLLKELARRSRIQIIERRGHSINVHECLKRLAKANINLPEATDIQILHSERNATYHLGGKPDPDDAKWLVFEVAFKSIKRIYEEELGLTGFSTQFKLSKRLKGEVEKIDATIEDKLLTRAQTALEAGHNDTSLLESFRGIEVVIREYLAALKLLGDEQKVTYRSFGSLIELLSLKGVISPETNDQLQSLRMIRNKVVHVVTDEVSKEEAEMALKLFESLQESLQEDPRLIYGTGQKLEEAVKLIFLKLGFSVGHEFFAPDFDFVITRGKNYVAGVKVKAVPGRIGLRSVSSLSEGLAKFPKSRIRRAVLVANAHYKLPPEERGQAFTRLAKKHARANDICLLISYSLYLTQHKIRSERLDESSIGEIRRRILFGKGEIKF